MCINFWKQNHCSQPLRVQASDLNLADASNIMPRILVTVIILDTLLRSEYPIHYRLNFENLPTDVSAICLSICMSQFGQLSHVCPVLLFWPKYRLGHPENYWFSLSGRKNSGSNYPKQKKMKKDALVLTSDIYCPLWTDIGKDPSKRLKHQALAGFLKTMACETPASERKYSQALV